MPNLIIKTITNEFLVTFKNDGAMRYSGVVVEIETYDDNKWLYRSATSSDTVKHIKDARVWFEWSFVWRGVWESRIYFKDDEYWGEEIKTISLVWGKIEALIKSKIKLDNPNFKHFDD